jgi:hypothetical protein
LGTFQGMRRLLWSGALLACAVFVGCGAKAGGGAVTPAPLPTAPAAGGAGGVGGNNGDVQAFKPALTPAGKLRRQAVLQTISDGLGAFLQYVSLDVDPVMRNRKFFGFRIAELNGDGWKGVDLKPGDIVTSVNGFPIEHPEQAMEAFQSTALANELRVDFERGGKMRSLRLAIIDE